MKKVFWYHIFPLLLAFGTLTLVYKPILNLYQVDGKLPVFSSDELTEEKTFLTNYNLSAMNELQVARSLSRPNQLTLFGSSELSSGVGSYLSNNFLPDSLGASILAIGHGYHELFAIYCELLYFKPFLKNSKINIVLSPGWFEDGKGTLPQSFIEYVPPHFISRIVTDSTISKRDLDYLTTTFTQRYKGEFTGKRLEYKYLEAVLAEIPSADKLKNSLQLKHKLIVKNNAVEMEKKTANWESWLEVSRANSLKTLNEHYIDSGYFKKYTSDATGNIRKMKVKPVPHKNNEEFQDLKMIVQLLKENNCEASFVMQPLNPYYYDGLENYTPIMDSISDLMKSQGFEKNYLNLFVTKKENYIPGILTDVMHFSEFGWITVNQFLYERHFDK